MDPIETEESGSAPDADMDVEMVDEEKADAVVAERITTKFMTKYERARILGTRALQLR